MAKVNLNKLLVFCGNQLTIFRTLSSIHTRVFNLIANVNKQLIAYFGQIQLIVIL